MQVLVVCIVTNLLMFHGIKIFFIVKSHVNNLLSEVPCCVVLFVVIIKNYIFFEVQTADSLDPGPDVGELSFFHKTRTEDFFRRFISIENMITFR